jgi:hypothetical protein
MKNITKILDTETAALNSITPASYSFNTSSSAIATIQADCKGETPARHRGDPGENRWYRAAG